MAYLKPRLSLIGHASSVVLGPCAVCLYPDHVTANCNVTTGYYNFVICATAGDW
jgi:hypothetical protein